MKWISNLFFTLAAGTIFGTQTMMVDPYFSPYSGSANLLFAQELLVWSEDAFFKREGRDTTSRVWGRAAEQILFWYNINILASVTQHEVFGHGYRLRELGSNPKRYTVTPWGGATYFNVSDSFLLGEVLAVVIAGLEAEGVLARDLKMQWIKRGEIDGRLSMCYTQAQQSLFWYTLITQLGRLRGESASSGNDIEAYAELHNAIYKSGKLSIGKLTRWSLFNWLDPMTFYAYYAFFYYIAEGKSWSFPMFQIGEEIRYLPNVRIAYAPYAPEAYFENFLSINGDPLYFYFKGGKRSAGIGVGYDHLFEGKRGTIGFRFDGWSQGVFLTTATAGDFEKGNDVFRSSSNKKRWGMAFSVRSTLNLFSKLALFTELGGKTYGYLPGYGLRKEVVARMGLSIGSNSLVNAKLKCRKVVQN